jgi:hypothetical protein
MKNIKLQKCVLFTVLIPILWVHLHCVQRRPFESTPCRLIPLWLTNMTTMDGQWVFKFWIIHGLLFRIVVFFLLVCLFVTNYVSNTCCFDVHKSTGRSCKDLWAAEKHMRIELYWTLTDHHICLWDNWCVNNNIVINIGRTSVITNVNDSISVICTCCFELSSKFLHEYNKFAFLFYLLKIECIIIITNYNR